MRLAEAEMDALERHPVVHSSAAVADTAVVVVVGGGEAVAEDGAVAARADESYSAEVSRRSEASWRKKGRRALADLPPAAVAAALR